MKAKLGNYSLTISLLLFVFGIFLACYFPGWFLVADAFALAAVLKGSKSVRISAAILLITCLFMAVDHYFLKIEDDKRFREWREKLTREFPSSQSEE